MRGTYKVHNTAWTREGKEERALTQDWESHDRSNSEDDLLASNLDSAIYCR